jgi:UrcA family protein
MRAISLGACLTLGAGAAVLAAAPAQSQVIYDDGYVPTAYVDEVVVPAPYHRYYEPNRLSARVSYRDLDLTTYEGRRVLDMRIRDTARDICRRLGEENASGDALAPSCVDGAIRSARPQVRTAIAESYRSPVYAWNEPVNPYPY